MIQLGSFRTKWIVCNLATAFVFLTSFTLLRSAPAFSPPPELLTGCWVAYSPTRFNPNTRVFPNATEIGKDLDTLKAAGFTGIVTYGSDGTLGTELPHLACEKSLSLIMGIWNPDLHPTYPDKEHGIEEYENAVDAPACVVGYVVGNEGLNNPKRPIDIDGYDKDTLEYTMNQLRMVTNKPVTTTEEWGDYLDDPTLLDIGDWVFPDAHPYYLGKREPSEAVKWTEQSFSSLDQLTNQQVIFKEVGLPSAGSSQASSARQGEYYRDLQKTNVAFIFFEAFDQPWKLYETIGPYWGLFTAKRAPKTAASYACGNMPATEAPPRNYFTTATPILTWNGINWATAYQLQVDRARTFANPVDFDVTLPDETLWTTLPTLTNGMHYWRIRAQQSNGMWGAWSATESFLVDVP